MNAWVTARRLKSGAEEEFRRAWAGGGAPDGMTDAFLLQDVEDPRNTLSVSLWDAADHLMRYRTSDGARDRDQGLSKHVDRTYWSRGFIRWSAADVPRPMRRWLWMATPLALAAAGLGVALALRMRRGSEMDDSDERTAIARGEVDGYGAGGGPVESTGRGTGPDRDRERGPAGAGQGPYLIRGENGGNATPRESAPVNVAVSGNARRPRLLVRDVMTADPECIDYQTDLATAAKKMRDLNVGFLPVTADGRLAGVVTDRDITLALAEPSPAPEKRHVADLMSEVPVTVSPHVSVDEAAQMMAEHQVRRLPVVEGSRIVGIVSLGDLAVDGPRSSAGEALEEISEPAEPRR